MSDSSTTVVSDPSTMTTAASLSDMSSTVSLTDLQLAIVRILWEKGECTVLEVQEALAAGCRCAGLGSRILRVETAALAVLAMVMYHFEKESA